MIPNEALSLLEILDSFLGFFISLILFLTSLSISSSVGLDLYDSTLDSDYAWDMKFFDSSWDN